MLFILFRYSYASSGDTLSSYRGTSWMKLSWIPLKVSCPSEAWRLPHFLVVDVHKHFGIKHGPFVLFDQHCCLCLQEKLVCKSHGLAEQLTVKNKIRQPCCALQTAPHICQFFLPCPIKAHCYWRGSSKRESSSKEKAWCLFVSTRTMMRSASI